MLSLHRAERADALVPGLADLLATPPRDPFVPDVVAVPTKGVERWLAQRLSHRLGAAAGTEAGVCANVVFDAPARLVDAAVARALRLDPEDDPWAPERLAWAVLGVLDECADQAWCAVVGRYLGSAGDDLRQGRRLGLARRLADTFSSYGVQRPSLITAWAEGLDVDGAGRCVPADLAWQPQLWRRVRERLALPSPAERLGRAVDLLTESPGAVELPDRLSVFGPTRVPEDQLRVLCALSRHRDVHVWLVHPSASLWDRVRAAGEQPARRRERPVIARHPLLASMARDLVELQSRLAGLPTVEFHHPAGPPRSTLLGALQLRLRDDAVDGPAQQVDPADRSVEVHACHGRARQVEVLREVLVGRLTDDPTLQPRDILVMCPDVETIAPLVAAAFGVAGDGEPGTPAHPGQTLRVRLADRSLRQTNAQLGLLGTLLEIADGRVTASEVLDLAAASPVRRRFGFDDEDLERIREWATSGGARWGEDEHRRARFGLAHVRQGTWSAALDRLLLGVAMAEEDHRFVGPALPLDDVDSTDVDLAGRFAEFLERLGRVLARLSGVQPVGAWLATLGDALDLLAEATPAQAWEAVQARQVLAGVAGAAASQSANAVRLPDVRAMLADHLQGRPTRAGFRTGALTVCSLEPMRAVPHRLVCLLGLDDGVFPRAGSLDGDDLLLRDPCAGERDRRSEDRQLFLDALAAAEEQFVVLYCGADERTGALRPPAVPVGELLDALDRIAVLPDGRPVRERVVIRHPLQPVDPRNFVAGALGRPGPFSFDADAHRAAVAARGGRAPAPPFLARPLGGLPRPAMVDLDDLVAMLEHPVKWFLRHRLQISLGADLAEVEDRLPLEPDPLTLWGIGDRLLSARLAGVSRDRAVQAEWRRGEVPPRALGHATLTAVVEQVRPIATAVQGYLSGEAGSLDLTADLPSGGVVTGTVVGVHDDVVVRAVYSRLGAKHRLRAWVQLLALTSAMPERAWRGVTVGRSAGNRNGAVVACLRTPDAATAAQRLEDLVRLRERASREPLPMPPGPALAYARGRLAGDTEEQALADAAAAWTGSFDPLDEHHVLCWGEGAALADVAGSPGPAEQAWGPDGTRFGVLSRRVWEPLLRHEETWTA